MLTDFAKLAYLPESLLLVVSPTVGALAPRFRPFDLPPLLHAYAKAAVRPPATLDGLARPLAEQVWLQQDWQI